MPEKPERKCECHQSRNRKQRINTAAKTRAAKGCSNFGAECGLEISSHRFAAFKRAANARHEEFFLMENARCKTASRRAEVTKIGHKFARKNANAIARIWSLEIKTFRHNRYLYYNSLLLCFVSARHEKSALQVLAQVLAGRFSTAKPFH